MTGTTNSNILRNQRLAKEWDAAAVLHERAKSGAKGRHKQTNKQPNKQPGEQPNKQPHNSQPTTHIEDKDVRAPLSGFDLATCRRYAETQSNLKSPPAYATAIYRSGEADPLIQAWLQTASNGHAPPKWREFYRTELEGIKNELPLDDEVHRSIIDVALAAIDRNDYPAFKAEREKLLIAGFQLA